MCRSYGDQFETLLKDKRDLASYLKTQLELRNEQVFDLNDRLLHLQQAIDTQKSVLEQALHDLKEKSRLTIEQLENENLLLSNRDQSRTGTSRSSKGDHLRSFPFSSRNTVSRL